MSNPPNPWAHVVAQLGTDIKPLATPKVKPTHKTCNKCNKTLPLSEFYKKPENHGGTVAQCKECYKGMQKARRLANEKS